MLLGFKRRFAPYVEEGSKTHTIRGKRNNPPRVGETCHCYVDPRQKTMRLLGRFPCVRVEGIFIDATIRRSREIFAVEIEGTRLSLDECNALAWRDGFRTFGPDRSFAEMLGFWDGRLPFEGDVIHWLYRQGGGR